MIKPQEIPEPKKGQPVIRWASDFRKSVMVRSGFDSRWFKFKSGTVTLLVEAVRVYVWDWFMQRTQFGYKINQGAGTVTIYAGYVTVFSDSQEVSETDVAINGGTAASPHWVYVRYPVNDLSLAEIPVVALSTFPESSHNWYTQALFGFSKTNGVIKLESIAHIGSVHADIRE